MILTNGEGDEARVVLGQVLAKLYTAPGQSVSVASYAEWLAREKAAEKEKQPVGDTSARRRAGAKGLQR